MPQKRKMVASDLSVRANSQIANTSGCTAHITRAQPSDLKCSNGLHIPTQQINGCV